MKLTLSDREWFWTTAGWVLRRLSVLEGRSVTASQRRVMHARIRASLAAIAASACALAIGVVPGVASAATRHSQATASQALMPVAESVRADLDEGLAADGEDDPADEITSSRVTARATPTSSTSPRSRACASRSSARRTGPPGSPTGSPASRSCPPASTWPRRSRRPWPASTAQVVGNEEWGKGAAVNLGPTVNLDRDPRWGRSFEAFSEDPFLSGSLATSEIDGVQSQGELSQIKHYDDYDQETNRNTPQDDEIIGAAAAARALPGLLRDGDRPARHAASVMCSYATINGNPECQDNALENEHPEAGLGVPRLHHLRLRRAALDRGDRRRHRSGAAGGHLLRRCAARPPCSPVRSRAPS